MFCVYSFIHGSYNLEKVLNFSSRLEKSLNLVKVLKSPLNSQPCLRLTPFSLKLVYFAEGNLAHPRCKNLKKLTGNVKKNLWMNNYLFFFFYFKFYVFTSDVISSHTQSSHFAKSCCKK